MAHKIKVGGTIYEITGGRTLVNGTGYDITSGKALVGGTAYEVAFGLRWRCYKLKIVPGAYTITSVNSGTDNYTSFVSKKVYPSYSFSSSLGFSGTGTAVSVSSSNYSDYIGYYAIDDGDDEVDYENKTKRISVSKVDGKGTFGGVHFEAVEAATAPITFAKGNYIELLPASAQELPSTGALLEGGISEGYCVMYNDSGSSVYYYELS